MTKARWRDVKSFKKPRDKKKTKKEPKVSEVSREGGLFQHEKFTLIEDFGRGLRGLGGLSTSRIMVFPGSKFGAANRGRRLSRKEKQAVIEQMKKDGRL